MLLNEVDLRCTPYIFLATEGVQQNNCIDRMMITNKTKTPYKYPDQRWKDQR